MPKVLTEASTIVCPHKKAIKTAGAGSLKLRVRGSSVLVEPAVSPWVIEGCPNSGPNLVPCTAMTAVNAKTGKLRVQNKAVVTEPTVGPTPTIGTTNGSPLNTPVSVTVNETKLSAI